MASFNKVILMGNLTRDPEIRQAGAVVRMLERLFHLRQDHRPAEFEPIAPEAGRPAHRVHGYGRNPEGV